MTRTYGYGYDAVGQLASVTIDGAPARQYSYDANGNRLTVNAGGVISSASYDDQDRVLGAGDRNGVAKL